MAKKPATERNPVAKKAPAKKAAAEKAPVPKAPKARKAPEVALEEQFAEADAAGDARLHQIAHGGL
jgi:hypothetical protein